MFRLHVVRLPCDSCASLLFRCRHGMALWATFPVDSEIQMSGYPVLRLLGLFLLHIGYWFYNNSELSDLNLVSRGLVNDGTLDQFGSTNQCVCFLCFLGSTSQRAIGTQYQHSCVYTWDFRTQISPPET